MAHTKDDLLRVARQSILGELTPPRRTPPYDSAFREVLLEMAVNMATALRSRREEVDPGTLREYKASARAAYGEAKARVIAIEAEAREQLRAKYAEFVLKWLTPDSPKQ